MSEAIYLVSAMRTPIGNYLGSLASLSAAELGAIAVKGALHEINLEVQQVDEVIVGNVLSASAGMGIGRQVSIKADIEYDVPAYSLNMVCGSGMKAIGSAYADISANLADIVIAVGTESMSNSAFLSSAKLRHGIHGGSFCLEDEILQNGLTDAFLNYPMGITAENIASYYHISRLKQDSYALESQKKASFAQINGVFVPEIVAVNTQTASLGYDEAIRSKLSMEILSRLKPAFKIDGTVTAGNASGYQDGASAVILASESAVRRLDLEPLAQIIAYGEGGVDPSMMGMGSVPAIAQAIERSNLKLSDIELLEINEAFSAQMLSVIQELSEQHEVDKDLLTSRVNIYGGALALGHPLGCSGNRIVTTLAHALQREQNTYGLAAICVGGGMGCALILKRT